MVLHELAHVLGLGHVDAADQVMAPDLDDSLPDLGAGDLTGLARLGQGACLPER
ncbi:matrixin family metalloprotease [Flavimobilis sp. GY10621]|uniref:Matrixin family metalloprotease n=1 Tax=Flavimobilis rhizosphaerae TaxID=2775421 RepID=A0ABR9DNB9_9MICO|nr:matrixin family metalloprotease [Flavimobilis rhizosphaerae]MBD9697901.1 matrixin family metalloprotease [Flavimobilis rhizosphaerae]